MGTVQGMLSEARKLIGLGEEPPGSNHNLVTRWYGMNDAWCDMAVSYIAAHSDNLPAVMGKHAWTVAHAKAFQRSGRWHFGLAGIRPGDIVFFDWSGTRDIDKIDHVGIVEACFSDGTIGTLEGNTSDAFLRRKRNASTVVGYGRPAYGDAAPLPSGDGMLRRGSSGAAVRSLQQQLNTVMGSKLAVDGDFGPATEAAVRAFQARYGLEVDGVYGPKSAAAMKAALAGQSGPIAPVPRPSDGPLVVDGEFGPATCAALQRALNAHGAQLAVDGAFGPATKKALQRYLSVSADGEVGPQTVKALQARIGAAVDGVWGPDTTRRLQIALNANRF